MVLKSAFRPACVAVVAVAIGLMASRGRAAEKSDAKETDKAAMKTVELFAAMESGDIDVKLIPKDSKQSTVLIENKLNTPLRIKLPDAFAGVPVLGQMGAGGVGGMGMGGMGGGMGGMGGMGGGMGGMGGGMGGGQGVGGGMGGMGGGMGGMGGGMGGMGGMGMGGMGGFFNVKPGKVGKLRVPTVCLEHGKTEPNPRMAYKLVPIETLTTKPEVIELCKMLGTGKLPQSAAQAAAWHFSDNMTWEQLAQKVGVDHLIGPSEPYFTGQEIQAAMQIAAESMRRAQENPIYREKTDSLSQK
jgi:hypothetical protein